MALRTVIALVFLARVAVAQSIATTVVDPPKPSTPKQTDHDPRWHFGLSFGGGAESIGDMSFGQIGIRVAIARRIAEDLAIATTGELITTNATLDDGTLIIGRTVRGTLGLDWRVIDNTKPFIPDLVIGSGIGRELTAWDRGTVARQLVFLSVEGRSGFTIPRGGIFHGISEMGTVYGLRVQAGRPVEPIDIALSCTDCKMTKDGAAIDLGVLFYYGIDFGR